MSVMGRGISIPQSRSVHPAKEKFINFYDYDGTLLFSYTKEEAHALTELPNPPSHDGLVFTGWNWEFDEIVTAEYPIDIAALYNTDTGAMKVYINIPQNGLLNIGLQFYLNGEVDINWGDGSITENILCNANQYLQHTYSNIGEYVISIKQISGGVDGIYQTSTLLYDPQTNSEYLNSYIKRIEFGNYTPNRWGILRMFKNVRLESLCLNNKYIGERALEVGYVPFLYSAPNNVGLAGKCIICSIGQESGLGSLGSESLRSITIPKTATELPTNFINASHTITSITIPDSVTIIGVRAFANCYSMAYIKIPKSVQQIKEQAFQNWTMAHNFDLSEFIDETTIPVLSSANAFNGISSYAKFLVSNQEMLEAFSTATNWSTYADRFVIKET